MKDLRDFGYFFLITMSMSGRGSELDLFPWLRHFGNKAFKDFKKCCDIRDQLAKKILESAVEKIENGEIEEGLLHGLVTAEAQGQLDTVEVRQLLGE